MTRQTFFEHSVLERDLGDNFFELPVLASQVFDFVTGGFSNRVARELVLARFEKVFAPAVVEVRGDALSSTEIGDTLLASESCEYDGAKEEGVPGPEGGLVRNRNCLLAKSGRCPSWSADVHAAIFRITFTRT